MIHVCMYVYIYIYIYIYYTPVYTHAYAGAPEVHLGPRRRGPEALGGLLPTCYRKLLLLLLFITIYYYH